MSSMKKAQKKLKIHEYQFHFKEILCDTAARHQYKLFLQKEFNSEGLLFWESCQSILLENKKSVLRQLTQTIFSTYFSSLSKQQINVSAETSKTVEQALDTFLAMVDNDDAEYFVDASAAAADHSETTSVSTSNHGSGAHTRNSNVTTSSNTNTTTILHLHRQYYFPLTMGGLSLSTSNVTAASSSSSSSASTYAAAVENKDRLMDPLSMEAFQIFQSALSSILRTLEKDSFVRFVRSESWLEFVRKQYKQSELEKIATHKSQLKQMVYNIKDEERAFISSKDVAMAKNLARDGVQWELFHNERVEGKYVKSFMLFLGQLRVTDAQTDSKYGKMKLLKVFFNMDCSASDLHHLMNSTEKHAMIFSLETEYADMFLLAPREDMDIFGKTKDKKRECGEIDDIGEDDDLQTIGDNDNMEANDPLEDEVRNQEMFHSILLNHTTQIALPFVKNRISYFSSSSVYDSSSKTYYELNKPVIRSKYFDLVGRPEPQNEKVVTMRNYSWTMIETVEENKCYVNNMIASNMGGRLDSDSALSMWTFKKVCKGVMGKIARNYNSALEWYVEAGKPKLGDGFKRFETRENNQPIADKYFLGETKKPDNKVNKNEPS